MSKAVSVEAVRIVVVLGMHRSGTSAITKGLTTLGVGLGDRMMAPHESVNPTGFWEDMDIYHLNVEMLLALGSEWYSTSLISQRQVDDLCQQGFMLRATQLLRTRIAEHKIFGFKDPRLGRLLPFWKIAFSHIKAAVSYVLPLRNPLSVAASLKRHHGILYAHTYLLWFTHTVNGIRETSGFQRVLIDFDDFLASPKGNLRNIASTLNLQFDNQEVERYCSEFLDTGLAHTKFHPDDLLLDKECPRIIASCFQCLSIIATLKDAVALESSEFTRQLNDWVTKIEELSPILGYMDYQFAELLNLRKISSDAASFEEVRITNEQYAGRISALEADAVERSNRISILDCTVAERDNHITGLIQAAAEREGQIASLNGAVAERDDRIAGLDQAVAERDGQIAILNGAVAERDVRIAGLDQAVAERDGQIAGLNSASVERDSRIAGLHQAVAERDGQIASLNGAVVERDGRIAELNQAVVERDGQIASLNGAVTERDGRIAELNQAVAERDGQIASLSGAVTELNGRIAGLDQAIFERDSSIASLNFAVTERDAELLSARQVMEALAIQAKYLLQQLELERRPWFRKLFPQAKLLRHSPENRKAVDIEIK